MHMHMPPACVGLLFPAWLFRPFSFLLLGFSTCSTLLPSFLSTFLPYLSSPHKFHPLQVEAFKAANDWEGWKWVGVHLRRADFLLLRKSADLADFVCAMRRLQVLLAAAVP